MIISKLCIICSRNANVKKSQPNSFIVPQSNSFIFPFKMLYIYLVTLLKKNQHKEDLHALYYLSIMYIAFHYLAVMKEVCQ